MAVTTIWISPELKARVEKKTKESGFSPGQICTLAAELWAEDAWTPAYDPNGGSRSAKLFFTMGDEAFIAANRKRQQLKGQVTTSSVYRCALDMWVEGKWDMKLVLAPNIRPNMNPFAFNREDHAP